MKPNAAIWFEINVQDMARAKTFYEAVFRVALEKVGTEETEGWMFPMQDGTIGAGGALFKHKVKDMPTGPGGTTVYFACEDCAVEEARAAANGGKVILSKKSIGQYGFCSIVQDSEGNHIGLHSLR